MTALLIGYARCSTDEQDLTVQREGLAGLGVTPDRIYVDCGLTGSNRERPGLPKRGPRPGTVTPSASPNSANPLPCGTAQASAKSRRRPRNRFGQWWIHPSGALSTGCSENQPPA